VSGAGVRLRKDLQQRIHGAFPSAPRFLIFCARDTRLVTLRLMRRKGSLLNVGFRRSTSEMNSRFAHQSGGVTSLSDCFLVGL
jgi:hypothetical protein